MPNISQTAVHLNSGHAVNWNAQFSREFQQVPQAFGFSPFQDSNFFDLALPRAQCFHHWDEPIDQSGRTRVSVIARSLGGRIMTRSSRPGQFTVIV
jgi:hypothetical protein